VYSEQLYKTEFDLLNIIDMQKLGSAITYAQRYGLLSIMGLASGIDDDGNEASEKRNTEQIIKRSDGSKAFITTHKQQIENDMLLDKFKSIMIDYKEMFTEDELSIYRTYYSNKEYEKIKETIKLIETRVMKG